MLCLLCGMLLSLQHGIADVSAYILQEHLDAWAEHQEAPEFDQWSEVKQYFDYALFLSPDDPAILQQGGKLYEWRYFALSNTETEQHTALDEALHYLQLSVTKRPTWPYSWLELAIVKARANQTDELFQKAYQMAYNMGQWEPSIQIALFDLGLSYYPDLDADNQVIFYKNMHNSVSHQAIKLIDIAREHQELPFLCRELIQHKKIRQHCSD